MTSSSPPIEFANLVNLPLQAASSTWVSLATMPFLASLVGGQALASTIQAVGVLSEEIFRGDRLPLLDLSSSPSVSPEPEELS
jgi:hypothetical protein